MCFCAAASFTAGGVLCLLGVATLKIDKMQRGNILCDDSASIRIAAIHRGLAMVVVPV